MATPHQLAAAAMNMNMLPFAFNPAMLSLLPSSTTSSTTSAAPAPAGPFDAAMMAHHHMMATAVAHAQQQQAAASAMATIAAQQAAVAQQMNGGGVGSAPVSPSSSSQTSSPPSPTKTLSVIHQLSSPSPPLAITATTSTPSSLSLSLNDNTNSPKAIATGTSSASISDANTISSPHMSATAAAPAEGSNSSNNGVQSTVVPSFGEGVRVRISNNDVVRSQEQLKDFAGTDAVIIRPPVHPNTWYVVRLEDGSEAKLRSSCFDPLVSNNGTPLTVPLSSLTVATSLSLGSTAAPLSPSSTTSSPLHTSANASLTTPAGGNGNGNNNGMLTTSTGVTTTQQPMSMLESPFFRDPFANAQAAAALTAAASASAVAAAAAVASNPLSLTMPMAGNPFFGNPFFASQFGMDPLAVFKTYVNQTVTILRGPHTGELGIVAGYDPAQLAYSVRVASGEVLRKGHEDIVLTPTGMPMWQMMGGFPMGVGMPHAMMVAAAAGNPMATAAVQAQQAAVQQAHAAAASNGNNTTRDNHSNSNNGNGSNHGHHHRDRNGHQSSASSVSSKESGNSPKHTSAPSSPVAATVTPAVEETGPKKRRKPLPSLLGQWVAVERGKHKGENGFVTSGSNGYYAVRLRDGLEPVMKRGSDLKVIPAPPNAHLIHGATNGSSSPARQARSDSPGPAASVVARSRKRKESPRPLVTSSSSSRTSNGNTSGDDTSKVGAPRRPSSKQAALHEREYQREVRAKVAAHNAAAYQARREQSPVPLATSAATPSSSSSSVAAAVTAAGARPVEDRNAASILAGLLGSPPKRAKKDAGSRDVSPARTTPSPARLIALNGTAATGMNGTVSSSPLMAALSAARSSPSLGALDPRRSQSPSQSILSSPLQIGGHGGAIPLLSATDMGSGEALRPRSRSRSPAQTASRPSSSRPVSPSSSVTPGAPHQMIAAAGRRPPSAQAAATLRAASPASIAGMAALNAAASVTPVAVTSTGMRPYSTRGPSSRVPIGSNDTDPDDDDYDPSQED